MPIIVVPALEAVPIHIDDMPTQKRFALGTQVNVKVPTFKVPLPAPQPPPPPKAELREAAAEALEEAATFFDVLPEDKLLTARDVAEILRGGKW